MMDQMGGHEQEEGRGEGTFEEVNQMLEERQSRAGGEVESLRVKVSELQKICMTLTKANQRLMQRVEELQEQAQGKNNCNQTTFNEEYSEMQCDFNDIEEIIKEYRNDLNKYQSALTQQLTDKNHSIERLTQELNSLNDNYAHALQTIDDLTAENQALEQTNQGLLIEVEELETNLRKSKFDSPRSYKRSDYLDCTYGYEGDSPADFNVTVQLELEKLIQKLIKELEHERTMKKKLSEEIRRLQKDLAELEKEIMSKNTKIYSLEIAALKSAKTTPGKPNSPARQPQRQPHERRTTRNFTLMELMNECVELTSKDKLLIALRIIDLYLRKVNNQDYSSLMLESLLVCNYSPSSPSLLTVRPHRQPDHHAIQQQYPQTQAEAIWNLAFLLDNLFNECPDVEGDLGRSGAEGEVLERVGQLLENREGGQVEAVYELKKAVEQAVALRRA